MDMDCGRNHHPWFVLAHEWPINNKGPEGDFMYHALKTVQRIARGARGVLPGDYNCTPVANLISTHDNLSGKDDSKPFLKRFGSDFVFKLKRRGATGE